MEDWDEVTEFKVVSKGWTVEPTLAGNHHGGMILVVTNSLQLTDTDVDTLNDAQTINSLDFNHRCY